MIVISRDFVVSAGSGDGENNDNPVIGYDNWVTIANITATSADAEFPISNVANPATYLPWLATSTAQQDIIIDTEESEPTDKDYVGIAGHNIGSAGKMITLYGWIGGAWVELIPQFMPVDDDHILMRFNPVGIASVKITISSGGIEAAQIAVIYFGKLLVIPRRLYVGHTPITDGLNTKVTNGRAEVGHFLGRIVLQIANETEVALTNIRPDWHREYFRPFVRRAISYPFFWAWRPGSYPKEVGFSWLQSDPKPVNSSTNGRMSITMQLGGYNNDLTSDL